MTDDAIVYCPRCDRESLAETPPCPEGHGELCPDRACLACGTALLCDVPLAVLPVRRTPAARRAA